MNAWFLYLIVMLDNFIETAEVMVALSSILFIFAVMGNIMIRGVPSERDLEKPMIKKNVDLGKRALKWITIVLLFLFFSSVFVKTFLPSSKQMAFIYVAPKMINNEQIQGISKSTLGILQNKAESYLNETILELETSKKKLEDGMNGNDK